MSVSRTGTPSPGIILSWTEHDSWREGDPPRDPNYSDRYWTAALASKPEPVNVIEIMVHDHSAFGKAEFYWEVEGTSNWGTDFSASGTSGSAATAKVMAGFAAQRASDEWWAEYDDSVTPAGKPGGLPWQR